MKYVILFPLLLAGCSSIEQIGLKDGRPLYETKCRTSTAECHKLAAEKCGGNYDVVETSKHIVDNYMTIQCKPSP